MKKYFHILKKCPLFSEIEEENLEPLLGCLGARICSYSKKDTVMAEGQSAKFIGIVLSGSVQIVRIDYYGNRSIVSKAYATQLFAEAFACAGEKEMPACVIASDESEVMFLDVRRILNQCCNACRFHSKIIFNLMKNMAEKNIAFHHKIQITSKRTTREKLMEYLMLEAEKNGKSSFEIPFDRQELADFLEVDRSGLSTEIGKLKREKIIENNKARFKLL